MTVREKIEDVLVKFGMFKQQAKKVMDITITKINDISEEYLIQWDENCEIYKDDMYSFIFSFTKTEALKWIEENCPNVWFKENYYNDIQLYLFCE